MQQAKQKRQVKHRLLEDGRYQIDNYDLAPAFSSFLPGIAGLLATGLAGALFFAYVLQGLAVLHAFSQGMPFRGLFLATVYIGVLLLGWVAVAIAILGLAEPMLRLRDRAATRGQPPNPD